MRRFQISRFKTGPQRHAQEIIEAARSSVATVSPAKEIILIGKIETLEHLEKRSGELTRALTGYCEAK